jgi:glycosyltransferase involved in cell wall biosynthesis
MRVGLVSPPWLPVPPPAYGGSEVVIDGLARGLVAAGHEVVLVAPGDSTCPVPLIASPACSDPTLMGAALVELAHVVRAYAALADAGVDLIHDHTLAGPIYDGHPPGIPVVTTHHGPFGPDQVELFSRIARTVPIIAISHDQAATSAGVPIARVIHHGIDVGRVPVGVGEGGFALFLGRMSPEKGVREAAEIARNAGVPLRIAAKMYDEDEHEYYRTEVRPLLGGDIEYIGEVGAAEKWKLLGQATALLNPGQWHEPFGLVIVESMACGTPVVATGCGAARELIRDGVTGFVRKDPHELGHALRKVAELDRATCRREAEDRFDVSRMVREHIEFYAEVLHGVR